MHECLREGILAKLYSVVVLIEVPKTQKRKGRILQIKSQIQGAKRVEIIKKQNKTTTNRGLYCVWRQQCTVNLDLIVQSNVFAQINAGKTGFRV